MEWERCEIQLLFAVNLDYSDPEPGDCISQILENVTNTEEKRRFYRPLLSYNADPATKQEVSLSREDFQNTLTVLACKDVH